MGDTFVVPVTAHTNPDGGFGLKAWSVQFAWNASVLTLDSYTSSSLYASPTTNLDSAAGTLTVAVVGTQSSTALADVTGTSISLLTLTFNVSSGANRTHAPVLSATALEFLNQGNFLFVSNQQAQINDARGGAQTDGQLTVEPVAVVGHLAHTDAVDMVNTAALSGSAVEHSVGVVELYSRAATSAADASSAFVCNSTDTAVLVTAGCTLRLSGDETGGASVSVLVSRAASGALLDTLPMRVWYPLGAAISPSDAVLNLIAGSSVYQSTDVAVLSGFGGSGLTTVEDIDVTGLVSVGVGDGSVAALDADYQLKGLASGSTSLTVTSAPVLSIQTTVTVSDTHVQLMELQVLVVTGIVWQSAAPATVPQVPPSAGFSAVAQLQQVLEAEGDEAKVFVYATFTDGMTQQVATSEVDLSANCSSVTVANGTASQPASLTVVEGATAYVGSAVAAVWRVGGETLGLGFGWANVSMPIALLGPTML